MRDYSGHIATLLGAFSFNSSDLHSEADNPTA